MSKHYFGFSALNSGAGGKPGAIAATVATALEGPAAQGVGVAVPGASPHLDFWTIHGFPRGSAVKNPPTIQEKQVRALGQPPGGGNESPLQCFYLETPMDRGACWASSPWGPEESDMS